MTRRILALTGRPGVGKSTAAEAIADIEGAPVVNAGEEIRNRRDRGLTTEPDASASYTAHGTSTWEMAQLFRDNYGDAGAGMACVSQIATGFIDHDVVVVDGVRTVEEAGLFEEVFDCPVHLIAVTADHETRLDRFADRSSAYKAQMSGFSKEALKVAVEYEMDKRTEREEAAGLDKAIEYANYQFENSGTEKDLKAQCARLLDDLIPLHD